MVVVRLRGLVATLVSALGLACAASSALAQQAAAELRSVTGVVFVQPTGGQVRIVQTGAKLSVGDTIGTQKGAFALVVFGDGSRLALRPESAMQIRGFSYKPDDPANDQLSVQLVKGWLRNVSGQIGKRGNENAFEMKVNDTTIGIRGTDFGVRLCDEECAAAREEIPEGVLPQSGRLGQVLSTNAPLERLSEGVTPLAAPVDAALFLGDLVSTADAEALLGLDDGTRIVLAPRSQLALRAEEDEQGRRAIRLDVKQGAIRVATPTQPAARLYGLLINAGELLGMRPDAALDVGCESAADPSAFACPAAAVVLRRGRSEVLANTGFRSLRPGVPQRLVDPTAPPPQLPVPQPGAPGAAPAPGTPAAPANPSTAPASPASPATPTPAPGSRSSAPPGPQPQQAQADIQWDTWAPGAQPVSGLRTYAAWRQQQAALQAVGGWYSAGLPAAGMLKVQLPAAGPGPRVGGLVDPLDIPRDSARPASAAERPQQGIYTAVFQGRIALANPRGQIVVPAGQGGFAPISPTVPPRPMPAAPRFMELDKELGKEKLFPGQCPK
jgi:hypothetical protein